MRTRLWTALLLLVVAGACGPSESPGTSAEQPSEQQLSEPPYVGPVEVGRTYPYGVSTHCGITGAEIGGKWWTAEPTLKEGDIGTRWMENYAWGTLRLVSEHEAFFSSGGLEVSFRRTEEEPTPSGCI